jgi:hypothetical protein
MRLMAASRVSEVAVREPELDGVQGAGAEDPAKMRGNQS